MLKDSSSLILLYLLFFYSGLWDMSGRERPGSRRKILISILEDVSMIGKLSMPIVRSLLQDRLGEDGLQLCGDENMSSKFER